MAFLKYSVLFAVLANVYSLPAPQVYYHPPPPPPPPPVAVLHHAPPPPPPPVVVHAAPHHVAVAPGPVIPIVSQSYDANPDGSYTFQYESADGSSRQEQGVPRVPAGAPGSEVNGGVAVQGRYVYQSPEGPITVDYIADENGYQPSGPNIHPEIVKAVAAQVALARSEGPVPPAPPAYRAAYAVPPPPPPPPPPPHYPYKA